jgi:hypothetical protein
VRPLRVDGAGPVTPPLQVLLVVAGVITSAFTRLNAVILGRAVSVPWLGVVAAAVVLLLAVAVLWLVRQLLRDGLRLRPRVVQL